MLDAMSANQICLCIVLSSLVCGVSEMLSAPVELDRRNHGACTAPSASAPCTVRRCIHGIKLMMYLVSHILTSGLFLIDSRDAFLERLKLLLNSSDLLALFLN